MGLVTKLGNQLVTPDLITRYAAPVSRYTSYPTAPHFHAGINAGVYHHWLEALPGDSTLSLYAHVPFCDTLCWFCGCNTKITRQYEPVASYLEALDAEIVTIACAIARRTTVRHIHWGGGSPTILSAPDLGRLMDTMCRRFNLAEDLEFAVEIDPRGLDWARIDSLAEAGLTRVSIGVQDFDPKVQAKINRIQTVDETRAVIDAFRDRGVASLNIDAIYGLPGQHEAELIYTLTEVVRMWPDRIALFGYAHVPWMKRHQMMIVSEADLPGVVERHNHAELAAAHRAWQLIHRTAAARLCPECVGNRRLFKARRQRQARGDKRSGTEPGRHVPRTCDRAADVRSCLQALGCRAALRAGGAGVIADAALLVQADSDGLVRAADDGFAITERGRPFARAIAARFDAYLAGTQARHSLAV